jgi:hypothetical protein
MSVAFETQERIENEAKKLVACIGKDIRNYFHKHKLSEIYGFKFKTDDEVLFTANDREKIAKESNFFEKNLRLKEIVSEKLEEAKTDEGRFRYYEWIVKNWGGIYTFQGTKDKIADFIDSVKEGRSAQFSGISSYSKIMSFVDPTKYFIYDSRVAYALNWLLLKHSTSETLYFRVPDGRNTDLRDYDIETIVNIYNIAGNESAKNYPKKIYYPKRDVYLIYNSFIRQLHNEMKTAVEKPYYIEMLLFALFDVIIEEVKNTVKINITL